MKKNKKLKIIEELLNGLTYFEISKKHKISIKKIKEIENLSLSRRGKDL